MLGTFADIWRLVSAVPQDSRDIGLMPATANYDEIAEKAGSLVRLVGIIGSGSVATIRARFSPDPLLDYGFEDFNRTWDEDAAGNVDQEGATLRKGGPWKELGSSGQITLYKTAPLVGSLRSAKFNMSDAATRLVQHTCIDLEAGGTYAIRMNYQCWDLMRTLDFAITERTAAGDLKYLQVGGAWDTTEYWFNIPFSGVDWPKVVLFTADEEVRYTVQFRATPSDVGDYNVLLDGVYIVKLALSTDAIIPNIGGGDAGESVPNTNVNPVLMYFPRDGRISAIASGGKQLLNICRLGPAPDIGEPRSAP